MPLLPRKPVKNDPVRGRRIAATTREKPRPADYFGAVPFAPLALGITVYLFGIGMIVPNATTVALAPLPNIAGFSSAILGTLQIGAGAVGSALAATIFGGGVAGLTAVTAAAGLLTVIVFAAGRSWIRLPD